MLKHASQTHGKVRFFNLIFLLILLFQIDYIVISGDLESHAVWEYSKEEHQESIRQIFSLFKKYFGSTRLFFSLGNHEGVPINK